MTNSEKIDGVAADAKANIENVSPQQRHALEVSAFRNRYSALAKLLDDTNNYELKTSDREYVLELQEARIVSIIRLYYESFGKKPDIKVSTFDNLTKRIQPSATSYKTTSSGTTYIEARVFSLIEGIVVKPTKSFFRDRRITKVEVFGFTDEEFETALKQSFDISSYVDDAKEEIDKVIEDARETIDKANSSADEYSNLQVRLSEIKNEIQEATTRSTSLNQDVARLDAQISEKRSSASDLEKKINSLKDTSENFRREIASKNEQKSELNKTLLELQDDINAYPTDLLDFARQGSKTVTPYLWLSLLPIAVIIGVTILLFMGAADLTAKYKEEPNIDLVTLVATRIPFAIIALGILQVCWQLAKLLIREVFRVRRQNLALQKLSIIAQDISTSSRSGLDIDDDQEYELRAKLKMKLLRSHLKMYLDDEFDFELETSLLSDLVKKLKVKPPKGSEETVSMKEESLQTPTETDIE